MFSHLYSISRSNNGSKVHLWLIRGWSVEQKIYRSVDCKIGIRFGERTFQNISRATIHGIFCKGSSPALVFQAAGNHDLLQSPHRFDRVGQAFSYLAIILLGFLGRFGDVLHPDQ